MRWACAAALVTLAIVGCGGGSARPHARVLTMASADPLGIEHDPAVAFFVARVAQLSGGKLRIAVDEHWARGATAREAVLLRDVAAGRADLGWAHTATFDRVGVNSFQALQAPLLVNRDAVQDAVIHSPLAAHMLAGTHAAGLNGLALLAGPFSHLVGLNRPVGDARDLRGIVVAVHDSALIDAGIRLLHSYPLRITAARTGLFYVNDEEIVGPPTGMEDDLDALFFDRYGGPCHSRPALCRTLGPWLATNAALWPRAAVLVANPRRLGALDAQERAWVAQAAKQAATYSTTHHDDDARMLSELCAAGVRMTTAPHVTLAHLRAAWRPIYRRLDGRTDARAALGAIRRLRARAPAGAPLRPMPGCVAAPAAGPARGVRSTLPDGVYRVELTDADLRAARANQANDRTGTATLTLRSGRWRLVFTEPGHSVRTGTYAGTPLRTVWATDGNARDEAYVSVVVRPDGALVFHVGSAENLPSTQAIFASHPWRRIGG